MHRQEIKGKFKFCLYLHKITSRLKIASRLKIVEISPNFENLSIYVNLNESWLELRDKNSCMQNVRKSKIDENFTKSRMFDWPKIGVCDRLKSIVDL